MLRSSIRIAAIVAAAGAAFPAMGSINITPTEVVTWGGTNVGRSLAGAQPSGFAWAWNGTQAGQVAIDANGRIYFQGQYTSTPGVGTIAAASHRAYFTATNSADVAVYDGLYDGGTKDGLNLRNAASSAGGIGTTAPRVAGSMVAFGVQFSGAGIIETGTGVNNTAMYVGTASGSSRVAQQGDTVTLNDTAGNPTAVLTNTTLRSISQQNCEINSSGTMVAWLSVPAAAGTGSPLAGQFVATTNAVSPAPLGNTGFLATKSVGGGYTVVAQGGQSAPGIPGARFQNGSNGVNGFFAKINRSGQVAFDGKLNTAFPVTTNSDEVAYIYTPGSGYTLIRREGQTAPDATGAADAGGAQYTGGISTARSFSDAGVLFVSSLANGDVVAGQNDSAMYIATTTGTNRLWRRGDQAPGAPVGTAFGTVPSTSYAINNSGRVVFGNLLQGAGVFTSLNPNISLPPNQVVVTPGRQGSESAIFTGTAGNLQMIARSGDLAPGMGGLHHNITTNNGSVTMNNRGDILFVSETTPYNAGDAIGVAGQPASSILPAGPTVLWGWTEASGLIPMFYTGQMVEVDSGVFKSIVQINVMSADNGDGGACGLNDNGQFAAKLVFSDSWAIVTGTVPAPGTGMVAALGLSALARRRRR